MTGARPAFHYLLDKFGGDLVGVEIGAWSGEYAIEMVNLYYKLKLFTVDNNPQPMIYHNVKPYDRLVFIKGESVEVAKTFPEKFFDYIYIDGGHDYTNVYHDIESWLPKLKSRGVFGGHDWGIPGVQQAVRDAVKNGVLKNEVVTPTQDFIGGVFADWYVVYGG